ncbi:MAG: hypothetical protein M1827_006732 [Pycnora praestabilis]|nr:MAG: hypothetical protein M1827_006732 [Pycnora praestabilis]
MIEDQNSKIGTQLDGEKLGKGESRVLQHDVHEIRLGSYEHLFRIEWQPVVLSFSFSSKELKGKDPLIPVRARLESLDIKSIIPYIIDKTTHVVAAKRNTAKGLQALINSKYIVTDTFVDAIVYAATPEDIEDPDSLSPLERDFNAGWPDASQYLPVQGKEPSERPAAFFTPNPTRSCIFEGYTFVFCEQIQFENLQAPITNGGGKALLFNLEPRKTTTEDIVRYVKNVAGDKGSGGFEDGSIGKGVVVVRFRGKKDLEEWAIELGNEVARVLDQRSIEQSEFLDAILVNDASTLRKPLPEEEDDDGATAPPLISASAEESRAGQRQVPQQKDAFPAAQPEVSQPLSKRIRGRRVVTSRFKGFDDGFDPSQLPQSSRKMENYSQMDDIAEDSLRPQDSQAILLGESAMDIDSQAQIAGTQTRTSRKRRSSPFDIENEEDMVDSLLPAAAAMKRRRIEQEKENQRRGIPLSDSLNPTQQAAAAEATKKSPKPKKEINVREVARTHLEAEEEAARLDQESLKASLQGMDVEQMRNLALIEEMEVKPRSGHLDAQHADAHGDAGNRWDERWNGRKNFKRFRRPGEGNDRSRRGQTVIVGLEEVKKKDFGIGDEYWLESDKHKKKGKGRDTQGAVSQSQSQPFATARSQPVRVPEEEGSDAVMMVDRPPRTPKLADKTNLVQSMTSKSSGKRPASGPSTKAAPPAKKQKSLFVRNDDSADSDDSVDELKFRFKKKR